MHPHPLLDIVTFFFFNDTATTEIYTLSLHDALPIFEDLERVIGRAAPFAELPRGAFDGVLDMRSEEHTSELQSRSDLVCRLLLEKKKMEQERRRPAVPDSRTWHVRYS